MNPACIVGVLSLAALVAYAVELRRPYVRRLLRRLAARPGRTLRHDEPAYDVPLSFDEARDLADLLQQVVGELHGDGHPRREELSHHAWVWTGLLRRRIARARR